MLLCTILCTLCVEIIKSTKWNWIVGTKSLSLKTFPVLGIFGIFYAAMVVGIVYTLCILNAKSANDSENCIALDCTTINFQVSYLNAMRTIP